MYSEPDVFGGPAPYPSPQAAAQSQNSSDFFAPPQQPQQQQLPPPPQQQQPQQPLYYPQQQQFPGQYPQQPQQQLQTPMKNCCQSKIMKYFVLFTVFLIGLMLIGAVGILCPFLLFNYFEHTVRAVPYYIFSVYCIAFGALLILVEFRIKFIVNVFLFIASYNHRAVFIIFTGTLTMCAFNRMETMAWIGYVLGGVIIFIALLHIVVGCFDDAWVKEQNAKYLPPSDGTPAAQAAQGSGLPSLDMFFGQPPPPQQATAAQYPSLASDSAMMANNNDPKKALASQAAQMPETQRLATAAGAATVQNMLSGQSAEDAAASAFYNPQVQSLALSAGAAAIQNPAMQNAAKNAATSALSNAYDRLFED